VKNHPDRESPAAPINRAKRVGASGRY
jgi:hypothetical protein